jgi:hypothetical protein
MIFFDHFAYSAAIFLLSAIDRIALGFWIATIVCFLYLALG